MGNISALRLHSTIAVALAAFGHPWWACVSFLVATVAVALEGPQ